MRRCWIGFAAAAVALTTWGCWWTQAGGGPARTGVAPYETRLSVANVAQLQEAWKTTVGPGAGHPVVHGGRIFVSGEFSVTALRTLDGAPDWQHDVGELEGYGGLAVADGKVHVPYSYPVLIGGMATLDEATGAIERDSSDNGYVGSPAVRDGLVAATGLNFESDLAAVVLYGDKVGFIEDLGLPVSHPVSDPMLLGNFLYVSSGRVVMAFALDSCTPSVEHPEWCAPAWTSADLGSFASTPAAIGNNALAVGLQDGDVAVLDTAGTVLWRGDTGSTNATQPAVAFGRLYVGAADGNVHVFDATGCGGPVCIETTRFNVGAGQLFRQPTVANDVVYVATTAGTVVLFPAQGCIGAPCPPLMTITVETASSGGSFVSVIVDHGTVYATTHNDTVAAYRVP